MARVLLLNGPNLNLLGTREPAVYGTDTLEAIEKRAAALARGAAVTSSLAFQSNAEHELIERIHRARARGHRASRSSTPAASRTPVSRCVTRCWRTALPFIEVHLSNTHAREAFRRHSYFSDIAVGVVCGLGAFGYEAAIRAAAQRLARPA